MIFIELKGFIIIIVLTVSLVIFFIVVFVHYRLIRKLPEPTLPVDYKTNMNKIKRTCNQQPIQCDLNYQQKQLNHAFKNDINKFTIL